MKKRNPITRAILALSRLQWRPVFHGNVDNPSVPGGLVAMWLIVNDDTGEGVVSVGCPPERPDIPAYIADCCTNPWMAVPDDGKSMTGLAIEFNRTITRYFAADGMADAQDITIACMTIVEAYLADVPARSRVELVNNISARLQHLRDGK
jgi:hypothetical protein